MTSGRSIPTGRTWRDLPPAPPSSFVPAPLPPEPVGPVATGRPKLWPFVLGGLGIVLFGFVVGLALPSETAEESPVDTSSLPDLIVPPSPRFPDEPSEPSPTVPSSQRLFSVPEPPPGFRESADLSRADSDKVEQQVVLTDGSEQIVLFGLAAANLPELPTGEAVQLRGVEAVVSQGRAGEIVISWIEPGNIAMSITAPESFGQAQVLALAESLEMR